MCGRDAPGARTNADSRDFRLAHQAPDAVRTASQRARNLADGHQLDVFAHKPSVEVRPRVTTGRALAKVDAPRGVLSRASPMSP